MNTGDTSYKITRREAMCELASIPMIALGAKHTLKATRHEEMLRFCTAALEGCWELHRSNDSKGRQHAFDCVCTYVPMLETIAKDSPTQRLQALDLAARYAILKTLMSWTLASPIEAVVAAQHARSLSNETGNVALQFSARTKLNWTFLRNKNYAMGLETMQECEQILKDYKGPVLPSGMIGNVWSSYALAQVHNGIDPDRALGSALDSEPLPDKVVFLEFTAPDQHFEAAKIYCLKGDPLSAISQLGALIDLETLVLVPGVNTSERERLLAVNILTLSLLQLPERDMGQIIYAWTTAMEAAREYHHEVMYDEAMANFAIMHNLWRGEQAIRQLIPLTSHW
jgi:hypothetical protein